MLKKVSHFPLLLWPAATLPERTGPPPKSADKESRDSRALLLTNQSLGCSAAPDTAQAEIGREKERQLSKSKQREWNGRAWRSEGGGRERGNALQDLAGWGTRGPKQTSRHDMSHVILIRRRAVLGGVLGCGEKEWVYAAIRGTSWTGKELLA